MSDSDPAPPSPRRAWVLAWGAATALLSAGATAWSARSLPPDPLARLPWPLVGAEAPDAAPPTVQPSRGRRRAALDGQVVTTTPDGPTSGYDLRIGAGTSEVRLVDVTGKVHHTWTPDLTGLPAASGVQPGLGEARVALPRPDGGLYVLVDGVGVVALARDGTREWTALRTAHHHFEVLPDGHLRVLVSEPTQLVELTRVRAYPVDHVVELDARGKEVRRLDLLALYRQSGVDWVPDSIDTPSPFGATWLETGADGLVRVALRTRDAIAVLDPDAKRLVREERGPWTGLAAFATTPDGGRVVVEQRDETPPGVLRLSPTGEVLARTATDGAWTAGARAAVQLLPEGRLLVTGGGVRELGPDGAVVWSVDPPASAPFPVIWDLRLPADCCAWLGAPR